MSDVIGYINFGDIRGNSEDANHKDWIEAMQITHAVNRNINPTSKPADALTKSQVHLGAIEVAKNADESSPELVACVAGGKVFPKVLIDLVRVSEGGNEVFYSWELTNAYISNYGVQGFTKEAMGDGSGVIRTIETMESISICYSSIKWSYKKKTKDGKPQGSVDTGWDIAANKKI